MDSRLFILLMAAFLVRVAGAQEFVPPRPPPLDPATDFEDMEEDTMEMGDEGFRPPPPPPPPGSPSANAGAPVPPPEIRPSAPGSNFGGGNMKESKLKFQIVDEFWAKGKKRGRGKKIRVPGS